MCIYHRKSKKADSWGGLKLLHLTELLYTCVHLLLLYESSAFNCAKGGKGNRGRNVGDTQTCSNVVSMWAVTVPNSSWAAPTKSVFVCIFITGVVGSKGDKSRFKKKQWVYSKHSRVCHTLFDQIGGHICTWNMFFLLFFCTKCAYEDKEHDKVLRSLITRVFFCPLVLINQAKLQSVQNHLFIFWDVARNGFLLEIL